jgi:hypothetical protein
MPDENRLREMREYQQRRGRLRRAMGMVTRTHWIRGEDAEAYAEAVRPFADHAKLLEAVNGAFPMPPLTINAIIREHRLPYDPEEFIFLSRVREHLTIHPERTDRIVEAAERVMRKYPGVNFDGVIEAIEAVDAVEQADEVPQP